jgi:hypothetical protein
VIVCPEKYMKSILRAAFGCVLAVSAIAQDAAKESPDEQRPYVRLRQNFGKLMESFRGLSDWDTHYQLIMDSVKKVYVRNGWDSESDEFSLSVVREVNAIPPWKPQERFDKLMELVSDRYLLDERQEDVFRSAVAREATDVFLRHSARIAQYAVEAIQSRSAGQPFTAGQVARWVGLAEPVFQDVRDHANRTMNELIVELSPQQRAIAEADLGALNRRLGRIDELAEGWARGQWQPSDWGMEEDPIQLGQPLPGTLRPGPPSKSSGPGQSPAVPLPDEQVTANAGQKPADGRSPTPPPPENPEGAATAAPRPGHTGTAQDTDPWARYVQRFIQKYKLDDAQQARAWKIYRDVKARADRYRSLYAEQLEAARRRTEAGSEEAGQARVDALVAEQDTTLKGLFQQLQRRLDRLPTRAQRRDAAPIALEEPDAPNRTPVKMHADGP